MIVVAAARSAPTALLSVIGRLREGGVLAGEHGAGPVIRILAPGFVFNHSLASDPVNALHVQPLAGRGGESSGVSGSVCVTLRTGVLLSDVIRQIAASHVRPCRRGGGTVEELRTTVARSRDPPWPRLNDPDTGTG